jgi:hypothetical protein
MGDVFVPGDGELRHQSGRPIIERYASGQLRGWSINVLALDVSPPAPVARRARPDWEGLDVTYREARLLKVSATSLPSNPSAHTLDVQRSMASARSEIRAEAGRPVRMYSNPRAMYAEIAGLKVEQERALHRRLARKDVDPDRMTVEELELAIKRLKLMQ